MSKGTSASGRLPDFRIPPRLCENVRLGKFGEGRLRRVMVGVAVSGLDCLDERDRTQDGDHPFEVVGQHVEAHLGADPFQRPGQEVGGSHLGLDGAEWVLDGLSSDPHAGGRLVQAALHGVDDGLMLPAPDPPFLTCCTL